MENNFDAGLRRCISCLPSIVTLVAIVVWAAHGPATALAEEGKAQGEVAVKPTETEVAKPAAPEAAAETAAVKGEEIKNRPDEPSVEPGNVTVNFKGADIKTVLAYISEVAGVDIVPAPDVKCEVDLKLTNKPWKTALDIIVRNYGFAYEREGDIIRVVTLNKLKQEELTTQTFALNYSKARDVVSAVKDIVTERGKVVYDERTNTVLVTDIPTNIYKIAQIIQRLDSETLQVVIDTLIIETTLGDDERLGIDWNIVASASGAKRPTTLPFDYYPPNDNPFNKYLPLVQSGATTTVLSAGGQTSTTPAGIFPAGASGPATAAPNDKGFPFVDYTQPQFANEFIFGTLDFTQLQATLEMIKKRKNAEVLANPRVLTLNNQEANIHVGLNVIFPKFERNPTTGKMEIIGMDVSIYDKDTRQWITPSIRTGITMKVTPHINDKKEILMDVEPVISDDMKFEKLSTNGDITAASINERTARTQARIKDGDTIFIGGLIHQVDMIDNNKMPILGDMMGDVPYLGLLFSHKKINKVKKELVFFVTVNIVREGQAIRSSPMQSKAPKAEFTLTQNTSKDAKPSKKQPWANLNNLLNSK